MTMCGVSRVQLYKLIPCENEAKKKLTIKGLDSVSGFMTTENLVCVSHYDQLLMAPFPNYEILKVEEL